MGESVRVLKFKTLPEVKAVPKLTKIQKVEDKQKKLVKVLEKQLNEGFTEETDDADSGYSNKKVEDLRFISDIIEERTIAFCKATHLLRPEKFYVIGVEYQQMNMELKKRLSGFYKAEELKPIRYRRPKESDVESGSVFVVKNKKNGTWHRCQVIKRTNERSIEVFLLDNGGNVLVSIDDLRYLHKGFVDMPVFILAVKVADKEINSEGQLDSANKTEKHFREMVKDAIGPSDLRVHFKEKECYKITGHSIWKADVSVIHPQYHGEILFEDFFKEFKTRNNNNNKQQC